MKKNKPIISIVIATFNSERLLKKVLNSIMDQSIFKSQIEILVVDGGSEDNTVKIAKSFGCIVINNPKVFPAWAKYIGYMKAKGKYLMFLDSDEIICNKHSLEIKLSVFQENPNVHAITGSGYISPSGYPFINQYINEFGDPFSLFIYGLSKDYRFYVPTMNKYYKIIKQTHVYNVYDFAEAKKTPIIELVAMGSIVDLSYLKKYLPSIAITPGQIPHLFNLLILKGSFLAIIKNDPLIHYSASSLSKYLGKIRSRVVNNIYTHADEGFRGRDRFAQHGGSLKKYFFIPYAFSIVLPLIDSVWLVVTRRNILYLIHLPLCLYAVLCILWYSLKKTIHVVPNYNHYG